MIQPNEKTIYDALDYPTLRDTALACEKCELCNGRTQVVFGHGPVPCDLMIIGEGPGEQEDLKGVPFIGRAGQLLTKILESVGINREKEAYITNTVKCRPPKNRTPFPSEIEACNPYLVRQIQLVQPRILILLGSPALKTIIGDAQTISRARGKWVKIPVDYMEDDLYIMPMFHPSYMLRNASREKGSPKWLTWEDMKEVRSALDFYKQEA